MRLARHKAPEPGLIEVAIELDPVDLTRRPPSEVLWAEALSEKTCRLRSIPYYAYGFSCYDVVELVGSLSDAVTGTARRVARAVKRSGHSTYRLFVRPGVRSAEFRSGWQPLATLGCAYEAADRHFVAIDVPPRAPEHRVRELLDAGQEAGIWRLEEALDEHPAAS